MHRKSFTCSELSNSNQSISSCWITQKGRVSDNSHTQNETLAIIRQQVFHFNFKHTYLHYLFEETIVIYIYYTHFLWTNLRILMVHVNLRLYTCYHFNTQIMKKGILSQKTHNDGIKIHHIIIWKIM